MRTILFLIILIAANTLYAQNYLAQQGKIKFHSDAPIEDIDAESNAATCLYDPATKKVTAKVEIKTFVFPKPLMQEHFNENYLESDKYPAATIEGVLLGDVPKKDGVYKVMLKATLDLHGVKQPRTIPAQITMKGGQPVKAFATFDVKLVDHNIKIPTAVVMKIAEIIKVDAAFIFNKVK
ncbi:MAG TPA: YceI family protein [Chitinophagales bacterium]|nr:YceI family protein [Chitinophagales bacterium]